ncbi:hypothetical protein Tco_1548972 [Tanacetum coccineum]
MLTITPFVEEPVEIMEREIKRLKRSRIPLVKVSRGTLGWALSSSWERERFVKAKIPTTHHKPGFRHLLQGLKLCGQSSFTGGNSNISHFVTLETTGRHGYAVSSLMDTAYWSSE